MDQQRYQEEVSGQDPLIREKYVELARAFNRSYRKAWEAKGMSTKLNLAVLTAVNFEAEQIDLTVKLKGLVSKPVMEGIINRVVDRSQANFRPAGPRVHRDPRSLLFRGTC